MRSGWIASLYLVSGLSLVATAAEPAPDSWQISGELAEACICKPPCTCQFGEGPSPGPGCSNLITLAIEKGKQGAVSLDGTKIALAVGEKGSIFYIDSTASAAQKEALRSIARRMAEVTKFTPKAVLEAPITQSLTATGFYVAVGDAGTFDTEMIIGADGKTPVVVENNGDVNVARLEKGKTRSFKYHDSVGNSIDTSASNSDRGHFDWSDQTKAFF